MPDLQGTSPALALSLGPYPESAKHTLTSTPLTPNIVNLDFLAVPPYCRSMIRIVLALLLVASSFLLLLNQKSKIQTANCLPLVKTSSLKSPSMTLTLQCSANSRSETQLDGFGTQALTRSRLSFFKHNFGSWNSLNTTAGCKSTIRLFVSFITIDRPKVQDSLGVEKFFSRHQSQTAPIHGHKGDKWTTSRNGLRGENRWPGELRDAGPSIRPKTYAVTCFTSGTVLISTLCGSAATVTGAVISSTPL